VPTGSADDVGDLAIRQVLNFTQHKGLAKRLGEIATSRRIVVASRRRSTCVSGLSCVSCQSGVCSALSGTSSIGAVAELARRANFRAQTLRRIASSHGFIAGPR